jgi:hypothetical protein
MRDLYSCMKEHYLEIVALGFVLNLNAIFTVATITSSADIQVGRPFVQGFFWAWVIYGVAFAAGVAKDVFDPRYR